MELTLLKAKIHRATVKQADLDYVGSITIDSELLAESGIMEYEKVAIADIDNRRRGGFGHHLSEWRCSQVRQRRRQGDYHGIRPDDARGGT